LAAIAGSPVSSVAGSRQLLQPAFTFIENWPIPVNEQNRDFSRFIPSHLTWPTHLFRCIFAVCSTDISIEGDCHGSRRTQFPRRQFSSDRRSFLKGSATLTALLSPAFGALLLPETGQASESNLNIL
jgi:hypothetical protein